MSERPYKPAGTPGLIPFLNVADCRRAIDFLTKAFGFKTVGHPMESNGEILYAEMEFLDARIMLGKEGAWGTQSKSPNSIGSPSPVGLYLYCEDVDGLYRQAMDAGATSFMPPEDMFWGDRMFKVTDPDGHEWSFARNMADFDPANVPTDCN